MPQFENGSVWHRWDLHFHTPSSYDHQFKAASNHEIVDGLIASGVRVVAITDHHRLDVDRIRDLQRAGGERLTVLPGIELRSELGGQHSVHFIGIFPPDGDLEDIWAKLSVHSKITESDVQSRGGDDRVYCDFAEAAGKIKELGGIVTVHGHGKSNSIEEIGNTAQFKQQIKTDLLRGSVDIIELGSAARQRDYVEIVFPAIGKRLPLVVGSDNHDIRKYDSPCSCWIRADPTFRGLLMALREPEGRVYLGVRPPEVERLGLNKTKYIRTIGFVRRESCPDGQKWFGGSIPLNSGLVAIVGNKGSGKSALADSLGLVGATRNSSSFSFLRKERFLHPVSGAADHFDVELTWHSGEVTSKRLSEPVKLGDPERLRYLPQEHVETVCNELGEPGAQSFESELKNVIFSHVPEDLRLEQTSLDDLVRFQTGEKQHRIDSLIGQMRDLSRQRAALELQADPTSQKHLLERIEICRLELQVHTDAKPAEAINPETSPGAPPSPLLEQLSVVEQQRNDLQRQIDSREQENRTLQVRLAVAARLVERLQNFEKESTAFVAAITQDAEAVGLSARALVSWKADIAAVEAVRTATTERIRVIAGELEGTEPPGLRGALKNAETQAAGIRSQLDAPNQAYQAYVVSLREWEERQRAIDGDPSQPDSLQGLLAAAAEFQRLPSVIEDVRSRQSQMALEILAEKSAQTEIYRTLFGPVQQFIDSHEIARNKLRLEFRAELVSEDFAGRLLGFVAQNRRGSFMGVDDGRERVQRLVETVVWSDPASVGKFLIAVDDALHFDLRVDPPPAVQVKDQLARNRRVEELFDCIYGLEYVSPKYILRWEDKELSMLSPGERGALLLVFYLLVDRSDIPLIIDQPEGNLDNHSVAKMLVDCIKEARQRRQVVIVTHNPNLAVVCDADQIIHVRMDKADGNKISYVCGALENPAMIEFVTDVLEGTRWAFNIRGAKYAVGG